MSRKIKLIWEFYGTDAVETAKHHVVHLKEFGEKNKINLHACDIEEQEQAAIAFMIVDETNMIAIRDSLRPKRGQWVD